MSARYWAIIPAAGVGSRMGAECAKQYLPLLGKAVIEWSLAPFLHDTRIEAVIVVIAANDAQWSKLAVANHPKVQVAVGGADRAASVRAGLAMLAKTAHADDWVLVHDAARPCLTPADLSVLIDAMQNEAVGGLLAIPVADTLKQADAEQRVAGTLPRAGLWRALTPQMFRFATLQRALDHALTHELPVTDEAAAIEALGLRPRLVTGRADNLKLTLPQDIRMAAGILQARHDERPGDELPGDEL